MLNHWVEQTICLSLTQALFLIGLCGFLFMLVFSLGSEEDD